MRHPIYRVQSFQIVAPYTLRVHFDDATEQTINFQPVLVGELYRSLQDLTLFNRVKIDSEVHTLVWPNGADFDPATLDDWYQQIAALTERAQQWELGSVFEPNKVYYLPTPYNSFGVAEVLISPMAIDNGEKGNG